MALILTAAVPLLGGLLYFEKRESLPGQLLTKPLLSALFILAAFSGPHPATAYFGLIAAGLLCCLAGDVFLIFSASRRPFLAGLVSFLTGHVLYAGAFFTAASPGWLTVIVGVFTLPIGIGVFYWLKPRLGKMLIPVGAYIVVITVMVIGAATLLGGSTPTAPGRVLAFSGAILFFLSDILVARHQFVARRYLNRLVGLPLYYAAQFMIAFSTHFQG